VRRHAVLITVLLLAVLLSSCQKAPRRPAAQAPAPAVAAAQPQAGAAAPTPSAPVTAAPAGSQPAAPQAGAPAAAPTPAQGQAAAAQAPSSQAPVTLPDAAAQGKAPPKALASVNTLMALDRDRRTLPEDFKIGPLGDQQGGSSDERAAMANAEKFFSRLVKGTIEKILMAPEARAALSDTLAYGLSREPPPVSFRLGTARTREDGEITTTVRLFGAEGTAEGEVYLSKSGAQWLVSDLQLSLAQMALKREKPKEKFFPSAYRWLLEE
jgi:hypothetical protein